MVARPFTPITQCVHFFLPFWLPPSAKSSYGLWCHAYLCNKMVSLHVTTVVNVCFITFAVKYQDTIDDIKQQAARAGITDLEAARQAFITHVSPATAPNQGDPCAWKVLHLGCLLV